MSLTITNNWNQPLTGGARLCSFTVTFDNSYPTGGETFDISGYFQGSPDVQVTGDDGYVIEHDRGTAAAGKLVARYGDYDATADGALIDVANTTDLSAVIVKVLVIGDEAL